MNDDIKNFSSGFEPAAEWEALGPNPGVEAKRGYFKTLRSARYLVPCRKENARELPLIKDPKGNTLLPLFTELAELEKWPFPREDETIMDFDALKAMAIDKPELIKGLVINPFGRSVTIPLAQLREIDSLTKGYSYERSRPGEIRFFPLLVTVPPLNAALKVLFDGFDTVYRAWLLLAQPKDELAPHLAMIIDFTGDRVKLFSQVADLLRPYMKKGDRFDLTKADYKLLTLAEKVSKPVYERE